MGTKGNAKKNAMIKALETTLGVVTPACQKLKISRKTHYQWMKEDEDYRKRVDDVLNVALDFAESKLHGNIKNGDTTSIIFFLKTKGKQRGYIERQELQHDLKGSVPIEKWISET
ncbi:hypothetical protein AGMMS49525_04820 [Bacteroidia bacterium]|nr:hypothetical protein AGMMS49525_04820 [Bacteroidia bacterium]